MGIYMALGVAAVLLTIFFLDKLPEDDDSDSDAQEAEDGDDDDEGSFGGKKKKQSALAMAKENLSATVKRLGDVRQVLLVPITCYTGLEQAFMTAEYTMVRV